jgi:hypothetical protein
MKAVKGNKERKEREKWELKDLNLRRCDQHELQKQLPF